MSDGWATFGKGVFVALAVAGGVWIGRGGPRPMLEIPGELRTAPRDGQTWITRGEMPSGGSPIPIAPTSQPPRELPQSVVPGEPVQLAAATRSLQTQTALTQQLGVVATSATPAAPQVESIVANGVKYGPTAATIRNSNEFVISLSAETTGTLQLSSPTLTDRLNGTPDPAGSKKSFKFKLPNDFSGASITLTASILDSTNTSSSSSPPITIGIPGNSSQVSITNYSNNLYADAVQSIPPQGGTVAALAGYLKLKGTTTLGSEIVRFALDAGSAPFVPVFDDYNAVVADSNGNWEAQFKIPARNPATGQSLATGQIVAYVTRGGQRFFSANAVPYSIVQVDPAKITISKISNAVDTSKDLRRTNQTDVNVAWSEAFPTSNARIILLDGNSPQAQTSVNASETGSFSWSIPAEGRHELRVAVVQGDQITPSTNSLTIDLRQRGPRPNGVELVNPQQTVNAAVIRVAFDEKSPLSAASGSSSINSNFFELMRDHSSAAGEKRITIASATYFRDRSVVELTVTNGLEADGYTLKVKPSTSGNNPAEFKDIYGNFLGAEPGSSNGKEFTFTFFKSVGEEIPSQSRGLSGVTGENAVYPEYTKPRTQPEGFNPSDKVVTRVARLYYFRDAHRVVQLLNREARSFKRQAVDQQQQLADNALRDAENSTIERRTSERAAVRAAAQARAAEHGLTQAQAALAQAQSEATAAGNELPNAERAIRDQTTTVTDRKSAVDGAQSAVNSLANASPQPDAATKKAAQDKLNAANAELKSAQTKLQGLQDHRDDLIRQRDMATARVTNATRLVNTALGEVQSSRSAEIAAADKSSGLEAKEDQNYKTLFRREVAAATADPDTYAKGDPESKDPLLQVSYSVIGEGEIQLRGPLKGVNMARTLINLIDSPVGQVRVAIHTVQVNGERGERMEPVVERIGRYIDQNRFLTSQSGQMLRNAVTVVAARKAEAAYQECDGDLSSHQEKYLRAFFGKQFIDELQEMDSEFLRADNKLLSLHSMDSTSLAQALFLMALAKNDARQEILFEFERLTTCELPIAETEYFNASGAKWKFGPPLHKQKYQFLGHNAKFLSLKGQFNVQVADPDTMTPMQREFIRLAQIFKSRLVAEREIQQRVMERGLIEDRFADYSKKLREAAQLEESAGRAVQSARNVRQQRISEFISHYTQAIGAAKNTLTDENSVDKLISPTVVELLAANRIFSPTSKFPSTQRILDELKQRTDTKGKPQTQSVSLNTMAMEKDAEKANYAVKLVRAGNAVLLEFESADGKESSPGKNDWINRISMARESDKRLASWALKLDWIQPSLRAEIQREYSLILATNVPKSDQNVELSTVFTLAIAEEKLLKIRDIILEDIENDARQLVFRVAQNTPLQELFPEFVKLRVRVTDLAGDDVVLRGRISNIMNDVSKEIAEVLAAEANVVLQSSNAASSRSPLDHKKFMDMLVDDAEDKYIEILEGTRAHTANIDNYLGRIITSLDDDFNTQFNNPTFKHIREAGRYWDVQMGQIETTTVLTNNRTFAKVSPQAQMEFDLPKRDILISEAFESAAAAYQDYGALLQDPTFLSLTKMYRGQPPSATYGNPLPTPMVRDVLPSLPSATNEAMMIQQGATSPDFPSALESLIPDPAIYKFETGTGFEVRPVIQPDGQAVTFHLNYMYTTNVREPVRADEKHLGRIKRHFVDTDVTLGNFEMREVSKYTVALKASHTSRGVPLLEDVPVAGVLFRPMPQQQSSLQQNVILSQATIFPTLFDLMGLRWAPAIADLGTGNLKELDFVTKNRRQDLQNRVFDGTGSQVDEFLRIQEADRRRDLYRPQTPIENVHPDGTVSPGMNLKELRMYEEPSAPPIRESNSRPIRRPQETTARSFPIAPPGLEPPPSPIQRQSYEVPAAVESSSKKPQLLPQYAPAAPRKATVRPTEPKQLPRDKAGAKQGLGAQSSQYRQTAENKIVLASAKVSSEGSPTKALEHEEDLFARPDIRPVSDLKAATGFTEAEKDDGKRRWFKLPYANRSK